MKWFALKIVFLLSLTLFVSYSIGEGASRPETNDGIKISIIKTIINKLIKSKLNILFAKF